MPLQIDPEKLAGLLVKHNQGHDCGNDLYNILTSIYQSYFKTHINSSEEEMEAFQGTMLELFENIHTYKRMANKSAFAFIISLMKSGRERHRLNQARQSKLEKDGLSLLHESSINHTDDDMHDMQEIEKDIYKQDFLYFVKKERKSKKVYVITFPDGRQQKYPNLTRFCKEHFKDKYKSARSNLSSNGKYLDYKCTRINI